MLKQIILIVCGYLGFAVESLNAHKLIINHQPHPHLLSLLNIIKLPHDGSIESIHKTLQANVFRKPYQERWHLKNSYADKRIQLMPLFVDIGLVNAVYPAHKTYDYILLLGTTIPAMRTRIQFLNQLWQQGVRAKKIIILVSVRPLDPQQEHPSVYRDIVQCRPKQSNEKNIPPKQRLTRQKLVEKNLHWSNAACPKTESDGAHMLWQHMKIETALKSVPVTYIVAPMKWDQATQKMKRASTGDTIIEWFKHKPTSGTCLAISDNPFIAYQNTVMQTIFDYYKAQDKSFAMQLETVGPASDGNTTIAEYLDAVAGNVYAEINQ